MEPSRGLCGDFEDGILRGRALGKSYRFLGNREIYAGSHRKIQGGLGPYDG